MREQPQNIVPEICLDTVRKEAETILAQARTAAAQCLADAEIRAQDITRQAHDEGLSQGYQEGFSQGRQAALTEMQQTMQLSLEKAERIIKAAEQEACQMIIDAERQIVEMTFAIVRKVLAREIEDNPTVILPVVKEALAKVRDQEQIVIRVNPEDYEMVLMAKRDLQLMVGREHAVSLSADHTIAPGGCVIDTALGTVDARLDTKLEMVYKAIQEILP